MASFLQRLYGQGFLGSCLFYFPVASLLRLILEIKDFLPLFTWFILQGTTAFRIVFLEKDGGGDLGLGYYFWALPGYVVDVFLLFNQASSGRLRSGKFESSCQIVTRAVACRLDIEEPRSLATLCFQELGL